MKQTTTFLLITLVLMLAVAQSKIAQFDHNGLRYSNWNAPYVTLDTCLDQTGTNIVIPDTVYFAGRPYPVVEIGPNAFRGCHNLVTVTLPHSMNNILRGAFLDCPQLRVVVIKNPRPIHIGMHPFYRGEWYEVFEQYHALTTALVVPSGSEQAYRDAPGWTVFKTIRSTWPDDGDIPMDELDVRIIQLESELKKVLQRAEQINQELDILRRARGQ